MEGHRRFPSGGQLISHYPDRPLRLGLRGGHARVRRGRHGDRDADGRPSPWLAGIVPFGLVIGVSAAQADIPALAGWLTGPLIYAGSAQLATIGMLSAGAAPMAVVAVALVINVRLIFYSATMARHWRGTPWWWRLAAGYLLVDPSVAVGLDGYRRLGRDRGHAHYLGGAVLLWVFWLAAIGAGAAAGAGLPAWLHLEFVIPLYLVGQAIAKLADPAPRRAIFAAAAVALLALSAPLQLGIALAIAAGVAAGLTARPAASAQSIHPLQPSTEVPR